MTEACVLPDDMYKWPSQATPLLSKQDGGRQDDLHAHWGIACATGFTCLLPPAPKAARLRIHSTVHLFFSLALFKFALALA